MEENPYWPRYAGTRTAEEKLQQLTEDWGFLKPLALIEAYFCEGVSPGICLEGHCDYSTTVEPDCCAGWCDECGNTTIVSADVLAGMI